MPKRRLTSQPQYQASNDRLNPAAHLHHMVPDNPPHLWYNVVNLRG